MVRVAIVALLGCVAVSQAQVLPKGWDVEREAVAMFFPNDELGADYVGDLLRAKKIENPFFQRIVVSPQFTTTAGPETVYVPKDKAASVRLALLNDPRFVGCVLDPEERGLKTIAGPAWNVFDIQSPPCSKRLPKQFLHAINTGLKEIEKGKKLNKIGYRGRSSFSEQGKSGLDVIVTYLDAKGVEEIWHCQVMPNGKQTMWRSLEGPVSEAMGLRKVLSPKIPRIENNYEHDKFLPRVGHIWASHFWANKLIDNFITTSPPGSFPESEPFQAALRELLMVTKGDLITGSPTEAGDLFTMAMQRWLSVAKESGKGYEDCLQLLDRALAGCSQEAPLRTWAELASLTIRTQYEPKMPESDLAAFAARYRKSHPEKVAVAYWHAVERYGRDGDSKKEIRMLTAIRNECSGASYLRIFRLAAGK